MLKAPCWGPLGRCECALGAGHSPSLALVESCHMMPLCPTFQASKRTLAFSLKLLIHKKIGTNWEHLWVWAQSVTYFYPGQRGTQIHAEFLCGETRGCSETSGEHVWDSDMQMHTQGTHLPPQLLNLTIRAQELFSAQA